MDGEGLCGIPVKPIILDKNMRLWVTRHDSSSLSIQACSSIQWDWNCEVLDAVRFDTRRCRYPHVISVPFL